MLLPLSKAFQILYSKRHFFGHTSAHFMMRLLQRPIWPDFLQQHTCI